MVGKLSEKNIPNVSNRQLVVITISSSSIAVEQLPLSICRNFTLLAHLDVEASSKLAQQCPFLFFYDLFAFKLIVAEYFLPFASISRCVEDCVLYLLHRQHVPSMP